MSSYITAILKSRVARIPSSRVAIVMSSPLGVYIIDDALGPAGSDAYFLPYNTILQSSVQLNDTGTWSVALWNDDNGVLYIYDFTDASQAYKFIDGLQASLLLKDPSNGIVLAQSAIYRNAFVNFTAASFVLGPFPTTVEIRLDSAVSTGSANRFIRFLKAPVGPPPTVITNPNIIFPLPTIGVPTSLGSYLYILESGVSLFGQVNNNAQMTGTTGTSVSGTLFYRWRSVTLT
jgi:hypothetical protein